MLSKASCVIAYVIFIARPLLSHGMRGGDDDADVKAITTRRHAVPHDKNYFIFLEVYALKGSGISQSSKTASDALVGVNVASLLQIAADDADSATQNSTALYHSEVLICPRQFMYEDDVEYLENKVKSLHWFKSYAKIPQSKWERMDFRCQTLSYGGSSETDKCSGVSRFNQDMSSRIAGIGNADLNRVWKYVYGTGDMDAENAKAHVCRKSCGKDWSGKNYNPVTRNCNYFSSTVLKCAYGLSQSTPNLGVSDMRRVWSCSCPTKSMFW